MIAILGWGSLLWDKREDFDKQRERWQYDGPALKLEFSRISESRGNALTLVIDPDHGSDCEVAYCLSKRNNLHDAIADLRCREGTTLVKIGYLDLTSGKLRSRDGGSKNAIKTWATDKKIESVIWTDLDSNFLNKKGAAFSVTGAISHLKELGPEAKSKAAEYVWRAPEFVKTTLRSKLQKEPWFAVEP
jgi:hypothetical protein